ncbi:hypothetical protein EWM64_g1734 [Hericium alpestre]|uniref:FAD linked oxidase N-terminal domain-containing protein n=1 Tax=Hericium alpestre TaxID=135208 RepID=A0A4Z0A7J4_9AGAM|nr:hypothetical protein EWM64_g1734 [Hericium alpestre]
MFQGSVPPYYIDVGNTSHFMRYLHLRKRLVSHLAIKNGGHDYMGRSSAAGALGILVHNLDTLAHDTNFSPEGCDTKYNTITAGTGATTLSIYDFADAHNVTLIGGYHQTITASGDWVLGGGHSILSPVYGLGIDRIVQFKLVTPDGRAAAHRKRMPERRFVLGVAWPRRDLRCCP